MTVITAFSSDALRRSLEQVIDGLEVEFVYPKQTGDAQQDPAKRVPKSDTISDWADIKYLISMTVGLSIAKNLPPSLTRPPFSMDDAGWIHIRQIGIELRQCKAKLALSFKKDFPFSLPFSLPLNLPISIPIGTVLQTAAIGQGDPVDVLHNPFNHDNLLAGLSSDVFGSPEHGLTLALDPPPGKLAEVNLDLKPRVCPTTRVEKHTLPDGTSQELTVECWGITFDGIVLAGSLLPGMPTIAHLLLDPLKQMLIDQTVDALADLLKDDPVFQFTHKDFADGLKFLEDKVRLAAAEAALGIANGAKLVAWGILSIDLKVLDDTKELERKAREIYIQEFNKWYGTNETDPEYPPSSSRFPWPPPPPPPPFPPHPFTVAIAALGAAIIARDFAQAKYDLDKGPYDTAVDAAKWAQQEIDAANRDLNASEPKMKALAHQAAEPIVAGFFNSLEWGMDLIFQLLNVAENMLNQSVMDWLDNNIGLFSGSHGMLKQVQDWIQDKLTFSVVPKVLEADLSSQLPSALKSRLKLLPLGVPVPDQPELTIQQKELSVAVQIGDVS